MASSLTYNVASDWGAGFVANMAIQAGDTALNGWLVEFDAAFTITTAVYQPLSYPASYFPS